MLGLAFSDIRWLVFVLFDAPLARLESKCRIYIPFHNRAGRRGTFPVGRSHVDQQQYRLSEEARTHNAFATGSLAKAAPHAQQAAAAESHRCVSRCCTGSMCKISSLCSVFLPV
jgi:hypothetical protein